MWNPFKKKDPMKATAGVYHLAETFIPELVKEYNAHFYEANIFEDIRRWKELLKDESKNIDFRFNKIETLGTDFKSNHDVYIVLIKWPEVKMPTTAKACMITINRLNHTAKQYILESSIYGSMVIEMTPKGRMNTGISVPNDHDEFTHFMMEVVNYEGILWKRSNANMTINLLKMKQEYLKNWLNSKDDTVRIFLLEGNDATLKCIRTFCFENIGFIKEICKKQLIYSKSDIDDHIQALYQQYTIEQLMQAAQVKFIVPESMNT